MSYAWVCLFSLSYPMEEMMEIGCFGHNTDDFYVPWQGGFHKLLSSAICNNYDPESSYRKCVKKLSPCKGLDQQESCITGVSEEVKNSNNDNAIRSNSDTAEEVASETRRTLEEQKYRGKSMAVPEKGCCAEGKDEKCRKRKRLKVVKNSEEVESQRMTHIEVERNRRKQMNEYLSVLRSLIPDSYIQRGDQASIIGGAIDLVKELEQVLQSLQLQKIKRASENRIPDNCLITLPQSSVRSNSKYVLDTCIRELRAENNSVIADIEVTLIETHASIKILSKKKQGQLLNIITALESLHMTTLHLNVSTIDQTVMFSFNIKIEEECGLTSATDIAMALQQILRIVYSDAIH